MFKKGMWSFTYCPIKNIQAKVSINRKGGVEDGGGVRCGDPLPPPKYMKNAAARGTPTECCQKASDFQKGKLISIANLE